MRTGRLPPLPCALMSADPYRSVPSNALVMPALQEADNHAVANSWYDDYDIRYLVEQLPG
jgi:hypothetical protein